MAKAHRVENIKLAGAILTMTVDGKDYRVDLAARSELLARATREQLENYELTPSGYGIHWPDLDEDLSIDGLIGIKHTRPESASTANN